MFDEKSSRRRNFCNSLALLAAASCFAFGAASEAKTTMVIHYGTKPTLTADVSPVGWSIFTTLDQLRAQTQAQLEYEIRHTEVDGSEPFYDVDVALKEDVVIEKTTRSGYSDIKVGAYGANMDWRLDCNGLINPSIDVELGQMVATATYDIYNGLTDKEVQLLNLSIDYSGGISVCGLPFIKDMIRDRIRSGFREQLASGIQEQLDDIDAAGIAAEGSQLKKYFDLIPNQLFVTYFGIDKLTFLQIIQTPFVGTKIKVFLNEDGLRTDSNANDIIDITIEVPWDQRPVANFTPSTSQGYYTGHLNASGSYDPDGGSIVKYSWDLGDGQTRTVTTPTLNYSYKYSGSYAIDLVVTDNEGTTAKTTQFVDFCAAGDSCLH